MNADSFHFIRMAQIGTDGDGGVGNGDGGDAYYCSHTYKYRILICAFICSVIKCHRPYKNENLLFPKINVNNKFSYFSSWTMKYLVFAMCSVQKKMVALFYIRTHNSLYKRKEIFSLTWNFMLKIFHLFTNLIYPSK